MKEGHKDAPERGGTKAGEEHEVVRVSRRRVERRGLWSGEPRRMLGQVQCHLSVISQQYKVKFTSLMNHKPVNTFLLWAFQ